MQNTLKKDYAAVTLTQPQATPKETNKKLTIFFLTLLVSGGTAVFVALTFLYELSAYGRIGG